MLSHTKQLLTKAERVAHLRAQLANQPHNGSSQAGPPIPTVVKLPNAGSQSTLRDFNEHTQNMARTRPDPKAIEEAITEISKISHKPGGTSKTASIKTPFNPVAASKKKVLHKHELRLTLDDRRPTVG
jgi:hypothetical protein